VQAANFYFYDAISPLKRTLESEFWFSSSDFGLFVFFYSVPNTFLLMAVMGGIILDRMGIRLTGSAFVGMMTAGGLLTAYGTSTIYTSGGPFYHFMGVFAVLRLSPVFADYGGVPNAIFWGVAMLMVGLLLLIVYTFLDLKLDKEIGADTSIEPEEPFRISDIGKLITNPGFITISMLCVLFYSAIFPFQKFATDMLASKLNVDIKTAAGYLSWFPIGALVLTPVIGYFLDKKGYGASMMLFGAILLTISHLIFALVPAKTFNFAIAITTIIILGTAFSLVPASMWPSIPKIVEERFLGSAYGLTFWIQNIGLLLVPILIGWSISVSNPGVAEQIDAGVEGAKYDYMVPELIFAGFGFLAILFALLLKKINLKNNYGLDKPNKEE
jgi:hypothetical protein